MQREDIAFYQDMHRLYDRILLASPACARRHVAPQSTLAYETSTLARFGRAVCAVVGRINFLAGVPYFSVRYEGGARWTLMGMHSRDWIEIVLVNARCFKITRLLCDARGLPCGFRRRGMDMEADVSNALRMVLGKEKKGDSSSLNHSSH